MEREPDWISVILLVDVMLVLLVIVLTTANFITTGGIPFDLAKARSAEPPREAPIVLTSAADYAAHLNDQTVCHRQLAEKLQGNSKDTSVIARAERMILLERFVGMVDEIRRIGFDHVSLQVLKLL
jgi:biopolymer transport protein ExbD